MSLPVSYIKEATESILKRIKVTGVLNSLKHMCRYHHIRAGGKLVGTDQFGNRYFEDSLDYLPFTRSRFVELNMERRHDANASAVPAEWHGWLHQNATLPPTIEPPSNPTYQVNHMPTLMSNLGAEANYVPAGYMAKAKDIKSEMKIRPRAYERWDPVSAGAKKN